VFEDVIGWWSRLPYAARILGAGVFGAIGVLVFLFWDLPGHDRRAKQWRAIAAARYAGWAEPAALERRLNVEHDACYPNYDPMRKLRRQRDLSAGTLHSRYLPCLDLRVLDPTAASAEDLEAGCAGARPWDCYRLGQRLREGTDEERERAMALFRRGCAAGIAPACDRATGPHILPAGGHHHH
jgi:hypothetical protein